MFLRVTIQGESPLLCHRFNDEAADALENGRSATVRTPERGTPRERAAKFLYTDKEGVPVIPGVNVFRSIIDAGKFTKSGRFPLTTAKGSIVPAAMALTTIACPILTPDGVPAPWEVDSRSIVNPSTGGRAMCHRPRFDVWTLAFDMTVDVSMFDEKLCRAVVDDAGSKIGLGAFRPARKGPFGRFKVTRWFAEKS